MSGGKCLVCGEKENYSIWGKIEFRGVDYTVCKCKVCDSIFYEDDISLDYSEHTSDPDAIADYVELNASVDQLAANILTVLKNRPVGKLIDIGCGFGFASDIAKRLLGWEVQGVEPSEYGRHGAKALGLNVCHEIIDENHELAKSQYDVVFSSEVIEHVPAPQEFLRLLKKLVKEDGIICVGTPCAEALDSNISESEKYAILSPSAHLFLYTKKSFENALKETGFKYVEIRLVGTSMVGYASNKPFILAEVDGISESIDYLKLLLEEDIKDESLLSGVLFRLYRFLIDRNRVSEASEIEKRLKYTNALVPFEIYSTKDFYTNMHSNEGILNFYRGMLAMNHFANYNLAIAFFNLSTSICRTKIKILPNASVAEADIMPSAAFHEILATKYLGDLDLAKNLAQKFIIDKDLKVLPSFEHWYNRLKAIDIL